MDISDRDIKKLAVQTRETMESLTPTTSSSVFGNGKGSMLEKPNEILTSGLTVKYSWEI